MSELGKYPLSEIYSDDEFNCRGMIAPMDVADLAKSIKTIGLQSPIVIQPVSDAGINVPGKKYRIIAGHRRFKAFLVLANSGTPEERAKFQQVEAILRTGLTQIDARVLNLSENLDRKELNLLQEAKAIQALYEAGVPRDSVAKLINKSSAWVQVRYNLLTLPEDIQQEAAAGLLNQNQIKQIYSLSSTDEQYAAIKKLKEAKLKGEKVDHLGVRRKNKTSVKKERKREEIFEMIQIIATNLDYGLPTRVLAWTAGEITTDDLFNDIREINPNSKFPTEL